MFWLILIIFVVVAYVVPGIAYLYSDDWRDYYKRSRENILKENGFIDNEKE